LWSFLTEAEAETMKLSFQFKQPLQIIKSGFASVAFGTGGSERIGFKVDDWQNLGWDRESVLLGISILIPYCCSLIISLLILKLILDKMFEYRKTLFLSTIEGERLSRIDPFSDLAGVPHALHNHISDLVRLAPASAHLQSKFKANLLKIISHFEIKERNAMPEHIQWACKVRPTPSNYIIDIKNYIRQTLTRTGSDLYTKLSQSDDSNSDVLEDSGADVSNSDEDSGAQERFKCYMFKSFEKKYERKVGFAHMPLGQVALDNTSNEFNAQKVRANVIDGNAANKRQFTVTATMGVIDGNKFSGFSVPSNDYTKTKVFDYVVVKSSSFPCDPRFAYCIKNVTESRGLLKFDLFSLDDFKKLEGLAGDYNKQSAEGLGQKQANESTKNKPPAPLAVDVELSFEDPYRIDDNFINFLFNNNAFDSNSLVASVKRVEKALENGSKNSGEHSKMFDFCGDLARKCCSCFPKSVKIAPINEEGTKNEKSAFDWNPYKDRIILTAAAIFYESVNSYRAIVSSTGLEGFCDMLIVNGSLNLSKWKIIGTIDQIMDEFHQNGSSKSAGDSRIPAFLATDAKDMSKITCRRSHIEDMLKETQNSSTGFHADCTLHGPANSSKDDFVELSKSDVEFSKTKTLKMISEANGIISQAYEWFTDAKHRYEEDIEWRPFQPGCSFEMGLNSKTQTKFQTAGGDPPDTAIRPTSKPHVDDASSNAAGQKSPAASTKIVFNDVRFTVVGKPNRKPETSKRKVCKSIELVDDNEEVVQGDPNCHLHIQCFQALEQKVEALCADEFEFSNPSTALYSHQLLHAYKPRGMLNASLSCLIHSCFCGFLVCPTLFFFVFWAYNNVNAYLIHPYWTPAAYVIIYIEVFAGISVGYLLVVYLEFPFIFYGKSLISRDINYFLFKPIIGVWYGTPRHCHFACS
jgi:hypothetical protein